MIEKRQKAREKFVRDFLDRDINNIHYYHLLFNNDQKHALTHGSLNGGLPFSPSMTETRGDDTSRPFSLCTSAATFLDS